MRWIPLISVMAFAGGWLAAMEAGAALVRREFRESDALLANPGQGWMSQARRPPAEPRFPYTVAYLRFNWADVEPEEGRHDWGLIDEVLAAWQPRGATVALRVMTCNAHSAGYYSSPKWLFDAGCRGFEYERGGDDPTSGGRRLVRIEPDYADPLYLEKHGAFLAALGKRYDGHPGIEFLDIGSYGIWGEWHTPNPAPVAVRQQIVDRYVAAFPRTPLVFMSDDAEVLPYALARGTGLRRDGVGSPWHEQNWIGSKKYAGVPEMGEAWQRAPVVFEWFGDYAYLQSRGWSFEAAVAFMLRHHVTLINDNIGRVPAEAMPQLEQLARRAGARLVLREIEHASLAFPGRALEVRSRWANTGVGRLYRPYRLEVALLSPQGQIVANHVADADPREWRPGEHALTTQVPVPAGLAPGEYTVAVGLLDAAGQRPPWRLAMDVPPVAGRYAVSAVTVVLP